MCFSLPNYSFESEWPCLKPLYKRKIEYFFFFLFLLISYRERKRREGGTKCPFSHDRFASLNHFPFCSLRSISFLFSFLTNRYLLAKCIVFPTFLLRLISILWIKLRCFPPPSLPPPTFKRTERAILIWRHGGKGSWKYFKILSMYMEFRRISYFDSRFVWIPVLYRN